MQIKYGCHYSEFILGFSFIISIILQDVDGYLSYYKDDYMAEYERFFRMQGSAYVRFSSCSQNFFLKQY